ncbi:hypothetical protein CLOP_g22293 [Closterium sp. NIES-67]|nr:hypothetical protein CLOP_g22293 [Closterium sp. NIES-67]
MDTGAGGTISGPLAASGGPDASSTYGGLDPSDVELSPAVTTVAFSPAPLPPLRLPVKAGPGDSPERGKWVLAFQDEASWRGAWGACERKIGEQCEVTRGGGAHGVLGARHHAVPGGAAVGAEGAGGGFLGVMELLGVGGGGGGGEEEEKEREACEEREMMACLATAQDACREHAQQQCATAFSQALIARSLTSIPLPLLDRRAQRALLRAALHRRQTAAAAEGSGRGGSRGEGQAGRRSSGRRGCGCGEEPGGKAGSAGSGGGAGGRGRGGGGVGGGGGRKRGGAVERGEREGAASGGRGGRRGVEKWVVVSGDPESGQGGGRRMVRVVVAGAAVPGTQQLVALSLAAAVGTRGTLNPGLLRGKHCLQWEAGK